MTDLTLVLATSVPPTIAALATLHAVHKSREVIDQVHRLTNSNLSRVLADLEVANKRIEKLEELVSDMSNHQAKPVKERAKRVLKDKP